MFQLQTIRQGSRMRLFTIDTLSKFITVRNWKKMKYNLYFSK